MTGISAYYLLGKNQTEFFKRSFRLGATFGLAASVLVALIGDLSAIQVAKYRPTKLAATELICMPFIAIRRNF